MAASRDYWAHADGGIYIHLGHVAIRQHETDEWEEGVAYRNVKDDKVYVTGNERWYKRFTRIPMETIEDALEV